MRRILAILFAAALVAVVFPATAQENLITNGGMEEGDLGPYQGKGRGNLNVPAGWDIWLGQDGAPGQYYDRGDKVYAFPHNGPDPDPYAGATSANVDGGYVQFRAALHQTVGGVQDGQNLRAEAASWVRACNLGEDAQKCGSSVESGAQTRIGIDPNGGTNPMASEIVWSQWIEPHDQWMTQSVEATASGSQVTVFLYYTQGSPADINRAYWDAVKLTTGGEGGSAGGEEEEAAPPPPTPVPYVDFVNPQAAGEDGSITHTVTQGDTLDSIAYAYGTTRTRLLELNPTLPSARWLQIGQQILVQEAPEPTPAPTVEPEPQARDVAQAPGDGDNASNNDADASADITSALGNVFGGGNADADDTDSSTNEGDAQLNEYAIVIEDGLATNASGVPVEAVTLVEDEDDGMVAEVTYVTQTDDSGEMAQDWFTLFSTISSITRSEDIPADMILLNMNDEDGNTMSAIRVSMADFYAFLDGDIDSQELANRVTIETS